MRLIPPTITLGFEPNHVDDPELQKVIADNLAWAIWLLWRPGHITSQYFNANCLKAAETIRKRRPDSMREYARCFSGYDFPWKNVNDWISQAYPFLIGAAKIHFEVKLQT